MKSKKGNKPTTKESILKGLMNLQEFAYRRGFDDALCLAKERIEDIEEIKDSIITEAVKNARKQCLDEFPK